MSEDVVTVPAEGEGQGIYRVPKSLIEAISDIQDYAVMESEGATDIPANFLTLRRTLGYTSLGFLYGLGDNAIVWIISPMLYAILFSSFPIFGHRLPGLFDKIFAFILAKYTTIGLLSFMAFAATKAKGTISKGCAFSLVAGYGASLVIRAIVFLFLYRWLYTVWPHVCRGVYLLSLHLKNSPGLSLHLYRASVFLSQKRWLLLTTSNYETIFSLLELGLLVFVWLYFTKIKTRRVQNPFYGRFSD